MDRNLYNIFKKGQGNIENIQQDLTAIKNYKTNAFKKNMIF